MNKIYYVYGLFEKDKDEPFYIGKGKGYRIKDHMARAKRGVDYPLYRKIRKLDYEYDALMFFENIDEDTAFYAEKHLIKKYGRRTKKENGTLLNITDGGDGASGYNPSKETLIKLSIASSGENNPMYGKRGKDSPLHGRPSGMLGKSHSSETKKKMSEARKGRDIHPNTLKALYENNPMHNPESRAKYDEVIKSAEFKAMRKKQNTGKNNGMYGKKQKVLKCPYCKKEGGNGAFVRWHFDNCKNK